MGITLNLSAIESVLSGQSCWAIVQGDCLEVMAAIPADMVHLCFGSPPYVDCRAYLEGVVDLGIARRPEEWSAWMRRVFDECLRVCPGLSAMVVEGKTESYSYDAAPALLMADMVRAGVCLRKPPIYYRFGIPGSGGSDWLKNCWEWIICATRGGRLPWSDNVACGKPPKFKPGGEMSNRMANGRRVAKKITARKSNGTMEVQGYNHPKIANPGNVIDPAYTREEVESIVGGSIEASNIVRCSVGGGILGSNLAHANEAPFPQELAEFFIKSFCPPDGLVLDPFAGSGTTLAAALSHGRRAIGVDLRASQVELTKRRLSGVTPGLFSE